MAEFQVISSSLGSFTGSIEKMLALGANDAECTLSRIEFGNMVNPESSFTPTSIISSDVIIPAGSYVEGPIGRVNISAGGFLIYIKQ
tara:strand:- start:695 stop:955 length:261 start_codon:yes stop_codon:yes gene_type:complete